MKLLKHIKKVAPISNELDIQNLLKLMKNHHKRLGTYQENLLLFYTVPELHGFLKEMILSYRRSYKLWKIKNQQYHKSESKEEETINGISKNGLSKEDKATLKLFSFRYNNEGGTLSDNGYEYGLSDW